MVDYRCPHCKFEMSGAEKYSSCPRCHALMPRWEMEAPRQNWLQRRREKKAEVRRVREAAMAAAKGQNYQQRNLGAPYQPPPPPPGWGPPSSAYPQGQPPPSSYPQGQPPPSSYPQGQPPPGGWPASRGQAPTPSPDQPPPTANDPPPAASDPPPQYYEPAPDRPLPPEPIESPERALADQVLCPNCGIVNRLESTENMERVVCQYCRTEIEL